MISTRSIPVLFASALALHVGCASGRSGAAPLGDGAISAPDAASEADGGVAAPDAAPAPIEYVSEERALTLDGVERPFVLARPRETVARLPLVIVLHGDGGSGPAIRAALPLEREAMSGAVFVYPSAPGGTFGYWTNEGRLHEVYFVTSLLDALEPELAFDRSRVFLVGWSGGATMANALGCWLGPDIIRGVGIHSGTLYPATPDEFRYTPEGGVSCVLPDAIFVWGRDDRASGVSFAQGSAVRDNYVATAGCARDTAPWDTAPCERYRECAHDVVWCPIPELGHAVWSGAASALWRFIASR